MLSHNFRRAFGYAFSLHKDQVRKGQNKTPYIGHLMAVSALALEYGADEDTAIAALLHDAIEDCGGMVIHTEIVTHFGEKIANIVLECSDTTNSEAKEDWQERKEKYIAKIKDKSDEALLILACDKLHNLSCTYENYKEKGENAFGFFKGKGDGTMWYYNEVIQEIQKTGRVNKYLVERLAQVHALLLLMRGFPEIAALTEALGEML